jgi:signal transduction histidine kinase/ActR/RegA family two-component response regulator
MARPGLVLALRAAIGQAKKKRTSVRKQCIEFDQSGRSNVCDVVVLPFAGMPDAKEPLFVVLFEEQVSPKSKGARAKDRVSRETPQEKRRLRKLEEELIATKEYMQSLIDDQDRTNDDLNSANEELVSGNEELQSMNEELETAKEELQSTNEELVTVNDELHNRNQEVAEINSDLLNLLATIDVPILFLDVNRYIRRFNPKARSILNILPSDVGRPLDDLKSNLPLANLDQQVQEVIETNTLHESEVQARDGRWYRMQIRPYVSVDNKIDGATLALVDIDTLKHHVGQAEDAKTEAERANRAKDEFLATLSHEIRTPLSSMLMQAQLLRRGDMDNAKVQRAGEAIERGTRMQVQLIDDLLDVSRIVTGKLKIEFKPVDLCAVVKAALEGVTAPAQRKGLTFNVSLDETLGTVSGDPTRLQQVVANLLTNAVKFSSDHGCVDVILDSVDGHARIRVRDCGSGIEPAFLPHVFNRFAQEDGSTIRRHGGLGLGLAIARHLVEAHGGTIHAESAGKGKGATFSIVLGLATRGSSPRKDGSPVDAQGPDASYSNKALNDKTLLLGLRVLVVDDDSATREIVSTVLTRTGAQVKVAESAAEAMDIVQDFRPEVLLCDIAMPREDGYSLLRRVRSLTAGQGGDVAAVALTAYAGEENRWRALSAGFQMHLTKPIDIDQLARAVAVLSRRVPTA